MENNQKEIILLEDLGMLYPTNTSKHKARYGLYECFCGNEFKARTQHIKQKNTKSCGCFQKEKSIIFNTKHSLNKHRLYPVWNGIIQRCTNRNNKSYKYYGNIGITVCDRWLNVANFIEDMYPTFKEGLSIDRIDNNLGYNPNNCRWVNMSIQRCNSRLLNTKNTTGFRGVSKVGNKFKAYIGYEKINVYLGKFETDIDAAKARNKYIEDNNMIHSRNLI